MQNRIIKIRVWNPDTKKMSPSMPLMMLAGYLSGLYPNLKNEVFRQATGSFDKNRKEIHEGDILKVNLQNEMGSMTPSIAYVEWCNNASAFHLKNKKTPQHCWNIGENIEIIGNMDETPELLT